MNSTSESLLLKLKHSRDEEPWNRFVKLYTPLIFYWARQTGLQNSDAADLVQDVLSIVLQKLPFWQYNPEKSFRGWLRTVTLNRHRELGRRKRLPTDGQGSFVESLASSKDAETTWDLHYARQLVSTAMELLKPDFAEITWFALRELVATGEPAAQIASKHGISVWTLYSAKSRLFQRLRNDLDGLL